MARDAKIQRGERPFIFADLRSGHGKDELLACPRATRNCGRSFTSPPVARSISGPSISSRSAARATASILHVEPGGTLLWTESVAAECSV